MLSKDKHSPGVSILEVLNPVLPPAPGSVRLVQGRERLGPCLGGDLVPHKPPSCPARNHGVWRHSGAL